jgi:1-acyl-sn-glycerol-3-phosphate acyltransferase
MTAVVLVTLLAVSAPTLTRLITFNASKPSWWVGSRASCWWSRWMCRILGVRIRVIGRPSGDVFVMASNHISYLDILVLGTLHPSHFVAKNEIRGWPLFGWISRAAGTLFVDRDSPRDAVRVIREMRRVLAAGIPITLFPEGGTSDGAEVRPFQAALLEPAAKAGLPCFGASVSYATPGADLPPSTTIVWSNGENFVTHFTRMMELRRIEATVNVADEPLSLRDRKELAHKLWEHTSGTYVPLRNEGS